jgi:nucleotide-binding universal stress UspA family protein
MRGFSAAFHFVEAVGSPGEWLLVAAQEIGADLIVVCHRGLNDLQSFFGGSTAEHVVHSARCSVLVVR